MLTLTSSLSSAMKYLPDPPGNPIIVAGEAMSLGGTIVPAGYIGMEIPQSPISTVSILMPSTMLQEELNDWRDAYVTAYEATETFKKGEQYLWLQKVKDDVKLLLTLHDLKVDENGVSTASPTDDDNHDDDDADMLCGYSMLSIKELRRVSRFSDTADATVSRQERLLAHLQQTIKNIEEAMQIVDLRNPKGNPNGN